MSIRTNFVAAIALGCALALPAAAQEVTSDTVLATVNGTDITIGHLVVLRETLPEQYQSLDDQVLFDGILDQVIQQTMLAQTVDAPSRAVLLQLENDRRALLAGTAMGRRLSDAISEDAVAAAYQEQYAGIEPSQEYNASHILVETEEEAAALVQDIAGGADFAALAQEFSTGPSGPNGGELGWFGPGMMVQPFEEAVVVLEVGDVSAPVQTQFGWHVIKLNDVRSNAAPDLEQVRAELVAGLQQDAAAAYIAELTETANVVRPDLPTINPTVLRDLSLVQN